MRILIACLCVGLIGCAGPHSGNPLAPSAAVVVASVTSEESPPAPWVNRYAGRYTGVLTIEACQADGGFAAFWCHDHPLGERLLWTVVATQSGAIVHGQMKLGGTAVGNVAGTMDANNWLPITGTLAFNDSDAIAAFDAPADLIRVPGVLLADLRVRVTQPGRSGSGWLWLTGAAAEP